MSIRTCLASVGLLLWLALIPAANAATVFEQTFTCPVGGETFKQQMAGSGSQFGQFFDLKPYGAIHAPWPMAVCPGNGFVIYKREFGDEDIARLTPFVESDAYRTLVQDGETSYYRAAALMVHVGDAADSLPEVLLQATWQASATQYPRYAAEALQAFEQRCAGLRDGDAWPSLEGLQCGMLVGELQRRLGRFDDAARTFAQARDLYPQVTFGSKRAKAYMGMVLDAQDALVAARSDLTSRLDRDQMRELQDLP